MELKGWKKKRGERKGEDGGGVGVRGGGRGVGGRHGAGDELLLEHRECYQKLNVMR